jgi:hypothetical protein
MRLALDPGKTTGVAWRASDGALQGIQWPGDDISVVLDGFHVRYGVTELVVESFISRPGPAVSLTAPVTIGRIQAWAEERGVPVVFQTPSAVKRTVDNDGLREAGGWLRGQQHARDALRHLLYRESKRSE